MSKLFWVLCFGLAACNYDVGECYVRGEGNDGAGGSIITPAGGVGGFGYVPLEPQSRSGYDDHPCSQIAECSVTWRAGSATCNGQGAAGTCTTLYQGEHASLSEAKERCEDTYVVAGRIGAQSCGSCRWATSANGDPVEECKKRCDRINRDCIARCPKGGQELYVRVQCGVRRLSQGL
jgi:hypothetical protein